MFNTSTSIGYVVCCVLHRSCYGVVCGCFSVLSLVICLSGAFDFAMDFLAMFGGLLHDYPWFIH